MHKAAYVSRYAHVLTQLQQHARALAPHFEAEAQAQALANARNRDPELDALFKLEALEKLLFAVSYRVNPDAYRPAEDEPQAEESPIEVPTAEPAEANKAPKPRRARNQPRSK